MKQLTIVPRTLFTVALAATALTAATSSAQQPRENLREPVYRVSNADPPTQQTGHPLDPALKIAYDGLAHIQRDIRDYTATLVKRERIDGELMPQEFMEVKVRNRKLADGRVVVPFGVYLKFLKPAEMAGRECIWVEGANENKLFGHEVPGIKNVFTIRLDPTGWFAMKGNRYPITEAGIETLTTRLIEKGERDRKRGECDVKFYKGAKINGRVCTLLQVTHPVKRPYFDFHLAQIFIDDELQVPVRYAAYLWPETPGGKPVLEEEYTYLNLNLNVGLTDEDFNYKNPAYKFPDRLFN
ncbi:MAG: DUF1571 domain-containing protein [Pirellulaceae bacterium]